MPQGMLCLSGEEKLVLVGCIGSRFFCSGRVFLIVKPKIHRHTDAEAVHATMTSSHNCSN